MLSNYIRAVRPYQWLKNLLVFTPAIAAHDITVTSISSAFGAFAVFCLIASGIYIVNDLLDLEADRAHPGKKNRPFASGAIPVRHGRVIAFALILAGLSLSLTVGEYEFIALVGCYLVLTIAYSIKLKKLLIIDICALAAFYTLRIFAGAAATDTPVSIWLVTLSIFLFFSLAAIKRLTELATQKDIDQDVSRRPYRSADRPVVLTMAMGAGYVSVLVLALYLTSNSVTSLYANQEALWALCPILLYWISRMTIIAYRGQMHDDPIIFSIGDRASLICALMGVGLVAFSA